MTSKYFAAFFAAGICLAPSTISRADAGAPSAPTTEAAGAARSTPGADQTLQTEMIRIRNVRPAMMAWWLDPQHQPDPVENYHSRRADEKWFGGSLIEEPAPVALDGVEKIMARDSDNALAVTGTPEAVRRLCDEIEKRDKPLRQIEIEAQFVAMNKTEVAQLGIDFSPPQPATPRMDTGPLPGAGNYSIGRVGANFAGTLQKLTQQKKVQSIQSPRVTTLDGYTASVGFDTNEPLAMHPNMWLVTSIGMACNTKINDDGTINLVFAGPVQWHLEFAQPQSVELTAKMNAAQKAKCWEEYQDLAQSERETRVPLTQSSLQGAIASANLKDGDTVVLSGLHQKTVKRGRRTVSYWSNIPGLGTIGDPKETGTGKEILIFVTARQVRRAEG